MYIPILTQLISLKNIKSKYKKDSNFVKIIIALFGLVIVFVIALILFPDKVKSPDKNFAETEESILNILELNDNAKLETEKVNLEFKNDWKLNSALLSNSLDNLKCEGECKIYTISKEENTFYLSNPALLVSEEYANFDTKESKRKVDELEIVFKQVELETFSSDETITTADLLVVEIRGCIQDICISSGTLSLDAEENKNQVDAFNDFLNSLEIINK